MSGTSGQDRHDDADKGAGHGVRLDKWLFFARFAKSRALAARLVEAGGIRVNGRKTDKPDQRLRAGDVLTIALNGRVTVVKVRAEGQRRGPPAEARGLYESLDAPGTSSRSIAD